MPATNNIPHPSPLTGHDVCVVQTLSAHESLYRRRGVFSSKENAEAWVAAQTHTTWFRESALVMYVWERIDHPDHSIHDTVGTKAVSLQHVRKALADLLGSAEQLLASLDTAHVSAVKSLLPEPPPLNTAREILAAWPDYPSHSIKG